MKDTLNSIFLFIFFVLTLVSFMDSANVSSVFMLIDFITAGLSFSGMILCYLLSKLESNKIKESH